MSLTKCLQQGQALALQFKPATTATDADGFD
jgi:hypothetical protein